jgi:hypothetical protein
MKPYADEIYRWVGIMARKYRKAGLAPIAAREAMEAELTSALSDPTCYTTAQAIQIAFRATRAMDELVGGAT